MKVKLYLSLITVVFLFFTIGVYAQSVSPTKVIKPVGFDISEKLSDVTPIPPGYVDRSWKEKVVPNKEGFLEEFNSPSSWTGPDPVLQDKMENTRSDATVGQNFAGIPNLSGVAPPDTDGDVGPNHYMQMVNLAFQIWDKNGNSLYGPADGITLWDGFTGPWSTTNDGDPIVLYDEYADRWIASQFALPNYPSGPFYELVAVSETGDPTGAWYRYAYEFADMPDYPKFGVWPDGYYFTINQFASGSGQWAGAGVCVLDRNAMINGDPNAEMLFFDLGTGYGSLLPADADGSTQPAAGSPNYLANMGTNSLNIWEADIDWATTGNSSISLVQTLSTASFSYSGIVVNQPGTSQTLDALASRLMYRLQYRNFGSYEVMLTNHTVNANGSGQAGVRWYEMRNYGSGWSIYQQGTFAPADADNRWMGSVAMNGNGDIAVGYSVSSSGTYPSIRIAGQTAANSGTGILDVTETSIKVGTTSQTGVNRWGDYSMMSVDPSDDATFWYTTEYSGGGWNWRTQIASFAFAPPVVVAPVADFSGNPTIVMEGQQVSFTDLSQNNPTSWLWSFPGGVPSSSTDRNPVVTYPSIGTYDVTLTVGNSAGNDTKIITDYITVTEYVITYCPSSGASTAAEWINSVSLGSFSNSSGSDGGYGDFTGTTVSLESGQSYNFTGTPGFSGRANQEYWRVWIDFNKDGDFTDSGEQVFAADRKKEAVTGTISIPSGLDGETRMRVSMKAKGVPSSCEQFAAGEVEDYTVSFSAPVPQAPVADFTGSPTSFEVGGVVNFTDQSLNNPTIWSWSFPGGTPGSSSVQNPSVIYNTVGDYDVTLTVSNAIGSDSKTIVGYITVTEGGGTGDYCASSSESNALEYISEVAFNSFSNPSGASLYSDFTSQTVGLTPGSNVNFTLTPFFTGKTQREFWRVWIDYNADGDFDDTGEQVVTANNQRDVVSGSFTVPSGLSGQTRMRVTMKNGGSPTSCETFSNGEVEDYTVDFGNAPALPVLNQELALEVFPNPASSEINIMTSGKSESVNLKIYDAFGRIIDDFDTKDRQITIDLSNYPNGIYYVGADDGSTTSLKKFIKE
jgi:PKD repeat protein